MGIQKMQPSQRKPRKFKVNNQYFQYSNLAFQILIFLGLAIWGGIELDQYLGLQFPWFTIGFMLLGLTGVFWKLYSIVNKQDNNS